MAFLLFTVEIYRFATEKRGFVYYLLKYIRVTVTLNKPCRKAPGFFSCTV